MKAAAVKTHTQAHTHTRAYTRTHTIHEAVSLIKDASLFYTAVNGMNKTGRYSNIITSSCPHAHCS